jgi:hypothetical protein
MGQHFQQKVIVVVQITLLMILSMSQANAQEKNIDDISPVIQEASVTTTPDNKHRFLVKIVDNNAVQRVLLSFRQEGATNYRNVPMLQTQEANWFQAEIANFIASDAVVDYVIQATDIDGNRSRRTYKFYPVVTSTEQNGPLPIAPDKAAETESGITPPVVKPANRISLRTVLYTFLGVLAVGALASSLDSGGSADQPPECCELTITAPTL